MTDIRIPTDHAQRVAKICCRNGSSRPMGQTTSHRGRHKQISNSGTSQIVNEVAFPFDIIYEQKTLYGFPRLSFRFTTASTLQGCW